VNTPKPCSCEMCGNPRKHHNEITNQETKAKVDFVEQVDQYYEDVAWWDEHKYDGYDDYYTEDSFMTPEDWAELYWWDNYEADLEFQEELNVCYAENDKYPNKEIEMDED